MQGTPTSIEAPWVGDPLPWGCAGRYNNEQLRQSIPSRDLKLRPKIEPLQLALQQQPVRQRRPHNRSSNSLRVITPLSINHVDGRALRYRRPLRQDACTPYTCCVPISPRTVPWVRHRNQNPWQSPMCSGV